MTTHLPKVERVKLQGGEADPSCQQLHAPEKQAVIEVARPATAEQDVIRENMPPRGSSNRSPRHERDADLIREGANMLELQLRQSRCVTPLSISSKATQVVLSRF